jgi:hypothetical protein
VICSPNHFTRLILKTFIILPEIGAEYFHCLTRKRLAAKMTPVDASPHRGEGSEPWRSIPRKTFQPIFMCRVVTLDRPLLTEAPRQQSLSCATHATPCAHDENDRRGLKPHGDFPTWLRYENTLLVPIIIFALRGELFSWISISAGDCDA